MTVREFVGTDRIAQNFVGTPDAPEWDTELTEDEVEKLGDAAYLDRIEEEHKELMAWMLFKTGNSMYAPPMLAERLKIPLHHVYAFYGIRGNARTGTY